MPTLERPDGTLVYDILGNGPPLLLISGLGGSRGYWSNLLSQLTARFTVILHDHMGTGETQSRREVHTIAALAKDVIALLDHLEIPASHVLGHSTGAAVGMMIAADHRARIDKLVLFAGWPGPDPHFSLCFDTRKALLRSAGLEAYHRASPLFLYPPLWIRRNYQEVERILAGAVASSPPTNILLDRIDMILAFDFRARLAEIKPPTLVLCANDDVLTPLYLSEELADGIPGARLVRLSSGGHAASQTNASEFLPAVLNHLV